LTHIAREFAMSRLITACVAFASLLTAAAPLRAQAPADPAAPEVVNDPAVTALLATKPATPRELFRAVDLLVEMGYPKVAKPLLVKLSETATDEAQLADVGRQFGRAAVDKLAGSPADLQPEARQVAERILTATRNQSRDPQRIAQLIELLKDPSYDARVNAMTLLRAGEDAAVDALLAVLLDPAREAEHVQVRTALAALEQNAVGPLAAMADAPDERVRISALKAAALFNDSDSIAPLYAAAFAPGQSEGVRQTGEAALVYRLKQLPKAAEAAAELYVAARSAFLRRPDAVPADATPRTVPVWKWDAAAGKPTAVPAPERIAELDRAGRLAATAASIMGRVGYARYLAWAAQLESAITAAGPDGKNRTAAAAAWSAGAKPTMSDLEGLLEFALETDHGPVAAETVRLLAKNFGGRALVSPVAEKPSPLVKATTHPDARVRMAAVDSILALGPSEPFVGAGGVFDAVGYFGGSIGARKALVVDVSSARARNVGGLTEGLGYRVETATTVREAVTLLGQDPDYELVLIARQMLLPQMGAMLGQLRSDYRTRRLPAVVYCGADEVQYVRTIVASDAYAAAIYEPRSPEAMTQLDGLLSQTRNAATAAERTAYATSILASAARLLDAPNPALNLRPYEARLIAAAFHPAASKPAITVLGKLGSPSAQRALADVASSAALPLEQRKAASQAFCESVIRFGTRLTRVEVLRQYDRYNEAETLDKPTQDLLAAILDVMEAKAATLPGTAGARASAVEPPAVAPSAASSTNANPAAASPPVTPAVETIAP
jgi:CheY-like chemotaxis protein